MSDRKPTPEYRFPRIHDLFLAFVPLKTQVPYLIEHIESCVNQSKDDLLNLEEFVYSAPGEGRVSPGLAVKEGRAYLRSWSASNREANVRDRQFTERRVEILSTALDYFHQTNREWRRQIENVRKAIDEAATELDQHTSDLLRLPSIQIRLAVDQLGTAVPYDGKSLWDHPDWPPFDAAWVENIKDLWPPVGKWMQRMRSIGHMTRSDMTGANAWQSRERGSSGRRALNNDSAKPSPDSCKSDSNRRSPMHGSGERGKDKAKKNPKGSMTLDRILADRGAVWEVKFDGDSFFVNDQLGIRYLAVALYNPYHSFTGREIHDWAETRSKFTGQSELTKVEDAAEAQLSPVKASVDKRLDPVAREAATRRRDELVEAIGKRKLTSAEQGEFGNLTVQLGLDTGLRGSSRALKSKSDSSRDIAARQAIKRLITSLKKPSHASFKRHLASYFKYSQSEIMYRPARTEALWTQV